MVCIVGGFVVVEVVLDSSGFQISNTQKIGLVIGADSASTYTQTFTFSSSSWQKEIHTTEIKSLPLDVPEIKIHKKKKKTSENSSIPLSNVT